MAVHGSSPIVREIRQHTRAEMFRDGVRELVRYVINPPDGAFVLACGPGLQNAEEIIAHAPDEGPEAIQLMFDRAEPLDRTTDASIDRYLAYHGEPESPNFFRLTLHAAKFGAGVVDASEIALENTLARGAGPLLKRWNLDQSALAAACRGAVRHAPASPLLVGVDPDGADVKARFGVIRIEFAQTVACLVGAEAELQRFAALGSADG
jgi:hypothetical protein